MRCKLFDCINNDDGYCCVDSYVEIEEDGTCSEMHIKNEFGEELNASPSAQRWNGDYYLEDC